MRQHTHRGVANLVHVVGANPRPGVDPDDYADFLDSFFPEVVAIQEIESGNFPAGLVLQTRKGTFEVRDHKLNYCGGYRTRV